ncbi:MAG: bifunctional phosphoribosylaminoimidazolecarboxamide formyltransferase/IMP cyclohydrolase [Verrucomicrobiota bacterium]
MQRALISVFDKTGLLPFARILREAGVEIISTGGTAKFLREGKIEVKDLSAHTGFPEMLDGRVKTLHPKVHGGLLYIRGNSEHETAAKQHDIQPIDLVVVNLYPFAQTVAKPDVTLAEAIENIDIGGPSMLRSAAKNHASVTVVVEPEDYAVVADQIKAGGNTTPELRQKLAAKVFARTSAYDGAIAAHLEKEFKVGQASRLPSSTVPSLTSFGMAGETPALLSLTAPLVQPLRYGENPHQQAALYGDFQKYFQQLHGKELSYNNILDLTAAASLIGEFSGEPPTLAILKHMNPCGVGRGKNLREAWERALATDKQAPFGGIIATNQPLDLAGADAISEIFSEVIVAPDFAPDALALLQKKKNLRLMKILKTPSANVEFDVRSVSANSFLVQQRDLKKITARDLKIVTKRQPNETELNAMLFGWRIVKHVKSNAIVYVSENSTLGVGAGQMSRIDSSRIAVWKAGEAHLSLKGSVVCSDAFFPFADGLVAAAEAGATAAIQPGGSVRDADVIAAADERNMAMAFTSARHFRH